MSGVRSRKRLGWFAILFATVSVAALMPASAQTGAGGAVQAPARAAMVLTDQFIFRPNDLGLDFFELETDLPWEWVPESFEWVRVDRRFLIPRARARLKVPAGTPVRYFDQLFQSPSGSIEVPVILTAESGNELRVGERDPKSVRVRFKHARPLSQGLVLDSNCSQTPIQVSGLKLDHSWVYVSCHTVHPAIGSGFGMRVDLDLRWESESGSRSLRLSGTETTSTDGVSHALSFNSESGTVHLEKGGDSFDLTSKSSERFHPLWVTLGIGPYSHQNEVRAFPTLYAGYYFSEGMRLASFTALPVRAKPEIDSGLYVVSEQFRGIDERIHVSLLLGAHILSFHSQGKHYVRMSAPQGVEMGFRDFLIRSQNLTVGGFFYPLISGRSYVNSWIRYGNARIFYEFNFINWQEPTDSGAFTGKSAGLSIGFPIFRAL